MRSLFFLFLIISWLHPAPRVVDEILSRVQQCLEEDTSTDDVIASLEEMENKELRALLKEYDKTWPRLRDKYLASFEDDAQDLSSGATRKEQKKMVSLYRQDFFRIYAMADGAMKKQLPEVSMPAIEGLRKILMPSAEEILSSIKPSTRKMRIMILTLARFRDAVVAAAVLPDQEKAEENILLKEKEVVTSLRGLPKEGLRIIAKNDEITRKAKIPEDERQAARQVNEWRLLLGLNALLIDPKLSNACRDHSKDMNKLNFFAHQSPVPGKRTPGDRARKAGTSWAGENIFMGSKSPNAANKGWFFSPGHHKNMFKKSHQTIGMGRYEKHWTQMFG